MSITFTGLASVLDRTVFTHKGPVVKAKLPLITGFNLTVISTDVVEILTGTFTESNVGHLLSVAGSPDGRNDGIFPVKEVLSSTRLRLKDCSFETLDFIQTVGRIVALANDLKRVYNLHRTQPDVHGTMDTFNPVVSQTAVDLQSSLILLNEIRAKFATHASLVGSPPLVHKVIDQEDQTLLPVAEEVASAILLANALRKSFEAHRQNLEYHFHSDTANRVVVKPVRAVLGTGPMVGPFAWTIYDPRIGQIADEPSDVSVRVNGIPASIDAVFGLLGAVVLTNKPGPTDSVSVDYSHLPNPPVQLKRTNSPEFGLNQFGTTSFCGLPEHRYRIRSYLTDPDRFDANVSSPFQPRRIRWKYKAIERSYSACLNDPNTLLLNVPSNRTTYPVLLETVKEVTVRYDPTTLPQFSTDPWLLEGDGTFTLAPGGSELTIVDKSTASGPTSRPPFFTHVLNLEFESFTSAAFRAKLDVDGLTLDGAHTGVGFGLSDGAKGALFGFIVTKATNLSSSIVLANSLKAKFGAHLVLTGSHRPNDPSSDVDVVDAHDLQSLIILLNRMKTLYNGHLAKGPVTVHAIADVVNVVTTPDAVFESDALALTNILYDAFNAHLTQAGVHYVNDGTNAMVPARQVGILTNRGYPEFDTSWNSYAVDWSEYVTYRIVRDVDGSVSLYLSGRIDPIVEAVHAELPAASDLDLRIDPMQQVFFGSVGAQTASSSRWAFIRVNVAPLDANQLADNKSVAYVPTVTPELDTVAPWITVGQAGFDRVSGGVLISDSTASADPTVVDDLGLTTGAFKGYLRLEPILSSFTTSIVEFSASLGYWTHSLDNKAAGVFLDDGLFSTHFVFLQATPTPATVTGTSPEPYGIAANDVIILAFGANLPKTVQFPAPVTTAAAAAAVINAALGFTFATTVTSPSTGSTFIKLTDSVIGAASKFQLIGGDALTKLGLSTGTYFGRDSNPEPKVAWFGEDFPDLDFPKWIRVGDQVSELLNRTLRVTDSSTSDYRSYTLDDPLFTAPVLGSAQDWKCDFRMKVLSFVPGAAVLAGSNLLFCGALVNLDEGPAGKNVEIQIAQVPVSGDPYLNILSFNPITGLLDSMAEFPFNWKDGQVHSYNIYTSKASGLVLVLADNVILGTFPYANLNPGVSVPSLSFGSGSNPVANADLRSAMSVIDWSSVVAFKDGKVSDPLAPSRRYVGIYGGGDPSLLTSYYVYQVDWTVPHTYRVVRDPVHGVSVFVDGGDVPVIAVNYDPLKLPPSSSSFLKVVTDSRQCISFGGFNPFEMSRTIWSSLRYSLGRVTLTDRRIPAHQVINQANVIASSEHLRTKVEHTHHGFQVYSGGTPLDDFLATPGQDAFTELGENFAPVPLTQNLETRGGLDRSVTPVSSVATANFVNTKGFLSDFEDDTVNPVVASSVTLESDALLLFIARVNDLRNKFNAHLVQAGVHYINDVANQVSLSPSTDLATALALVNDVRFKYLSHLFSGTAHAHIDQVNVTPEGAATDLESGVALVESLATVFASTLGSYRHIESSDFHLHSDPKDVVLLPNAVNPQQAFDVLSEFKTKYNAHRSEPGVHVPDDAAHAVTAPVPFDLTSSNFFLSDVAAQYNPHLSSAVHKTIDPANVFGGPSPPYATLDGVIEATNRLKAKYNAHIVQPSVHWVDDANNSVSQLQLSALTISIVVLNQLKAAYNAHIPDSQYHDPDVIHTVVTADAIDLPTSLFLANDMKVKFNAHFTYASSHLLPDFLNLIVEPNAFNVRTLIALVQALKSGYEAHRQRPGVHGHDDPVTITGDDAVDLASAIVLLNTIRSTYEAHRLATLYHKLADVLHAVTAPVCVDIFTAIQLASDLRGNLNAHFVGTSHVVPDSSDGITGSAGDLTSLINLTNEMRAKINLHFTRVQSGVVTLHVHGNNDDVHVSTKQTPVGALVDVIESFKVRFNAHRTFQYASASIHSANDVWNPLIRDANYNLTSPEAFETISVLDFVLDCVRKYNLHLVQAGVHRPDDVVDAVPVLPPGFPDDMDYAINLTNSLKLAFNAHIRGVSQHKARDTINFPTAASAHDPTEEVLAALTDLKAKYDAHVVRGRSHVTEDPGDQTTLSAPVTVQQGIDLANELKLLFNVHRVKAEIHVKDDSFNVVTAPDAVDLESLGVLTNDLLAKYGAHLVQAGVHGSSVFIRLDPPSRVLYNSMKAFVEASGIEGQVAPVSDDETWRIDTLRQDRPHSLAYEGGTAPERVTFISGSVEPFRLSDGDAMTMKVDDGPTDSYSFLASDIYASDVAERINIESCRLILNEMVVLYNAHLTEVGVHVTDDVVNPVPLPPALDLATSIALANQLRYYYNKHRFESAVHNFDDTFNFVGAGYAFNLDELIDLVNSLRLAFEGHKIYPSLHIENDVVNRTTRTGGGFAKDNGDGRVRLTAATPGLSSSLIVDGVACLKLGLDIPQFTPWIIKSSTEANVQVLPVLGSPDFLNYGTVPATLGTDTTYRSNTGLSDAVSLDIDMIVSIRIHNAYIDDKGDSNVYVGMNGIAGPGFSVAIGFDVDIVSGGCYVKLQDLKANKAVFRRLFNWNDGQFHTYRVLREAGSNSMNLMVVE